MPTPCKARSGDSMLAGRIRAVREAEERSRLIREAGILGPQGITAASITNSVEPPQLHWGVGQNSGDSGIAIDLNAAVVVEEGSTMHRTTKEALGHPAAVGGEVGLQPEAFTQGSDPFNLGTLIFGQPAISTTGDVGSRSKRGR